MPTTFAAGPLTSAQSPVRRRVHDSISRAWPYDGPFGGRVSAERYSHIWCEPGWTRLSHMAHAQAGRRGFRAGQVCVFGSLAPNRGQQAQLKFVVIDSTVTVELSLELEQASATRKDPSSYADVTTFERFVSTTCHLPLHISSSPRCCNLASPLVMLQAHEFGYAAAALDCVAPRSGARFASPPHAVISRGSLRGLGSAH